MEEKVMAAQQASGQTGDKNADRQSGVNSVIWCPDCGEEVRMILAEKAATVCQCSRRRIYRWIEDGSLHFVETPEGEALVCGRSLSKKMDELDSATNKLSSRNESGNWRPSA
jgi:hypothetical protein